ncbi:uncharacterized protein LOC108678568 [Hyalella azteca]|uniref:Uncharacterized protein LOC108678568 n=1 Tax=Hyalella azteca TaxID=294128 RepID=A0A8B7P9P6_HYAAZ|nr:uncharacterized protein LOC108678568 [Hyalella azteca]
MYYSSKQSIQPCSVTSVDTGNIRCLEPGCNFRIHRLKQFQHHLTTEHDIQVKTCTMYFLSLDSFYKWKEEHERSHGFVFNMLTTKDKANHVYYYCNLGRKVREVNGKKRMTNQCPTRLVLNVNKKTGQVYVDFIDGHYGHLPPVPKPEATPGLSKKEWNEFKEVMRSLDFDKDLVREYLMKADLNPVKRALYQNEFDKKRFHGIYSWAETFTAESAVTEWQRLMPKKESNAIIIHKRKGEIITDRRAENIHHRFDMEDIPVDTFMLGVMTDRQSELLRHYTSTIILELVLPQESDPADSVKQLYVLVMDQMGRELQVGFFVVSCPNTDTRAFRSFFLAVKEKCGNLKPNLLLVNERTCLFNCWMEVFTDHVPAQLLSPWFIIAEFESVLFSTMLPETVLEEIGDEFVSLVRELDFKTFEAKLAQLIKTLNVLPGASKVLDYISETLLPGINHDSSVLEHPKWAHHSLPEFIEDIALSFMTFTKDKLKGLHGFNNRKLGRCVFLMIQRQSQRRHLREINKQTIAGPNSRQTSDLNAEAEHDPAFQAALKQERQNKKENLKIKCRALTDSLAKVPAENLLTAGREVLEVIKSIHLFNRKMSTTFQVKVAEDLYRSLDPSYQSSSRVHSTLPKPAPVIPSVKSAQPQHNSSVQNKPLISSIKSSLPQLNSSTPNPPLTAVNSSLVRPYSAAQNKPLIPSRNSLVVKRVPNTGPIFLSSRSRHDRPNKRIRLDTSRSLSDDAHSINNLTEPYHFTSHPNNGSSVVKGSNFSPVVSSIISNEDLHGRSFGTVRVSLHDLHVLQIPDVSVNGVVVKEEPEWHGSHQKDFNRTAILSSVSSDHHRLARPSKLRSSSSSLPFRRRITPNRASSKEYSRSNSRSTLPDSDIDSEDCPAIIVIKNEQDDGCDVPRVLEIW